jgi:deoxyribodipyrimidine photo-lyase
LAVVRVKFKGMNVSEPKAVLLWYRLDLRVADNPALLAALASGLPVVPVFIWDPGVEGPWAPGRNSRWWLGRSLEALDADLRKRGSRLLFREGETGVLLRALAEETGARDIHYSRRYEPLVEKHEARLVKGLQTAGLRMARQGGNLLREPETLRTQGVTPFKVFTPFWKSHQALGEIAPPLHAPREIPAPSRWPASPTWNEVRRHLAQDGEAATPGLGEHWSPGSAGAEKALGIFLKDALEDYPEYRNIPAAPGTSRLAPHLHFGEISPRRIFHALSVAGGLDARLARSEAASVFRKELGWRDFAHHVLVHFPHTSDQPLRPEFSGFPWKKSKAPLEAWKQGRTGFPFIDAALRELLATGSMHNRARMATASFLVKDLMIPWQEGARWFWDLLVDADLAQNSLNWQWVAGCGADAAPYFRIFNPQSQGERFDPHGDYVRRWVPELADAPEGWIHDPSGAAPLELAAARVDLLEPLASGPGYPRPMVDHAAARDLALAAFRSLK